MFNPHHVNYSYRGTPMPSIERLTLPVTDEGEPTIIYRIGSFTIFDDEDAIIGNFPASQWATRAPGGEEDIEATKGGILQRIASTTGARQGGKFLSALRGFLDFCYEQSGVIDTTALDRVQRGRIGDVPFIRERILGNWSDPGLKARGVRLQRNIPERKAMALLYKRLDRKQRQQLKNEESFYHTGKAGHFKFMLHDMSGVRLITTMDLGGRLIETTYELCIQSLDPNTPKGDVILARYLECKHDEDSFLATCNFRDAEIQDEATMNRPTLNIVYGESPASIASNLRDMLRDVVPYETIADMLNDTNEVLRDTPWRD